MREVGITSRLSTRVFGQAVGFLARTQQLPDTHLCRQVASVAAQHTSTWTSTVASLMRDRRIIDFSTWRQGGHSTVAADLLSKTARKNEVKKYKQQVLQPALNAHDATWIGQQKCAVPKGLVLSDVMQHWWPLRAVRAWAQLRLQGYLSMPEGCDDKVCLLCPEGALPDLHHLFLQCPKAAAIIAGTVAGTSWEAGGKESQLRRFCEAGSQEEARIAVSIAAALRKRMWCQLEKGEDDSDTSEEDDIR
jgi:hypothetical protein